eukprot:SAG31_NODE_2918_length_4914_cov_3.620145_1_plen_54_part_00
MRLPACPRRIRRGGAANININIALPRARRHSVSAGSTDTPPRDLRAASRAAMV